MVEKRVIVIWVLFLLIAGINPISYPMIQISSASKTYSLFEDQENETDENENIENRIAIIDTSYGEITIELYERRAPITTGNFINLSVDGFYDSILFHRVIDDFVIQTGDPNTKDNNPYNDGSGGSENTIPLEIHPELTHIDGAVGMARSSDPDSASSQFYICDGPQHGLDGDYAVFGVVIDGIDVVRKIAQVETWGYKRPLLKDHPIDDVVMFSVFITRNNSEFQYTPTEDDGGWFSGDGFKLPGFDGIVIVIALVASIILFRKRYNS